MLRKAPFVFRELDPIFESRTLFDLPANLERRKSLLPIAVRKSSHVEIPPLKLNILSDESINIQSALKPKTVSWNSRVDCQGEDPAFRVTAAVHDPTALLRPVVEYPFSKRFVKVDIALEKKPS